MSIASEIQRLQTSKADIKAQVNIDVDDINEGTDFIDEETLDDYADLIEDMQDAYKQYIPINSTSDTQIEALKGGAIIGKTIKGNTSQNGTPTPSSPVEVNNVTGEQVVRVCSKNLLKIYGETQTINGVTFTQNENGSISVKGTATANAVYSSTTVQKQTIKLNTDYRLSGCPSGGSLSTYRLVLRAKRENGQNIATKSDLGSGGNIRLTEEEATKIQGEIYVYSGQTVDFVFYPQLEIGSQATEFEPYQGKDYEVNLGKNLLEPKMATTTQSGITCTNNGDGSFTLNGTATASTSFRLDQTTYNAHDNLKTYNGTYTLSCSEIENGLDLRVMQNSTWVSPLKMINSNTPVTATVDKNNCFIYINVANGKSVNNLTIRPMLEKGPVATSYSPYFEPIELNKIGDYQDYIRKGTGKNILPNGVTSETKNGLTITKSESGVITISGTSTAITYLDLSTDFNTTKYASYKFYGLPSDAQGCGIRISTSNRAALQDIGSNGTALQDNGTDKYIAIRIPNNKTLSNYIVTPMLIASTETDTLYEPYGYKDKWYIEKNIDKYKFLGTENWQTFSYGTNSWRLSGITYYNLKDSVVSIMSNIFQGIAKDNRNQEISNSIYIDGLSVITIRNTTFTSTTEVQNATKDNYIYYVPTNPTYTLIENEELLNQLERIMQLYEGQNNILVTGDLAATLDLDYIVKAENHL